MPRRDRATLSDRVAQLERAVADLQRRLDARDDPDDRVIPRDDTATGGGEPVRQL